MQFRGRAPPAEEAGPPDAGTLKKRLDQIELGKNTIGYMRYTMLVPKERRRGREHPRTPDAHERMPKRRWDTIIRSWRRQLHQYDLHMPPHGGISEAVRAVDREPEGDVESEALERRPDGTYVAQDMPAAGKDFLNLLWGPSARSLGAGHSPAAGASSVRGALLSAADIDAMRHRFCDCDDADP